MLLMCAYYTLLVSRFADCASQASKASLLSWAFVSIVSRVPIMLLMSAEAAWR
jgi:hypothetical protein